MISMEMMGKIRRMYFRDKLSLHEIAKRTGLSRHTIRKWVRAPESKQPVYQRQAVFNKLSPFHDLLDQALRADALRAKQHRRSVKAVRAFVPLAFALGEAFQFDWSEEGLLIGGVFRRVQVAHMKLCASRAFWLVAYPSQGHEMLFDAHTRSFAALGGVPPRGIYDNMKTAVDKGKSYVSVTLDLLDHGLTTVRLFMENDRLKANFFKESSYGFSRPFIMFFRAMAYAFLGSGRPLLPIRTICSSFRLRVASAWMRDSF